MKIRGEFSEDSLPIFIQSSEDADTETLHALSMFTRARWMNFSNFGSPLPLRLAHRHRSSNLWKPAKRQNF
jgi:hypothetical protein